MANEFIARKGIISLDNVQVSGSISATGGITISGSISSASFATTSATASSADSLFVRQNITGSNILATGAITAQTLVVQTVTSSIVYSSGSNTFGNQLTNVQQMTGSLNVTGSTDFTGVSLFRRGTLAFTLNPSYVGGNVYSQLQSTANLALAAGGDSNKMYISSSGYVAVNGNSALNNPPNLQGLSFGWNKSNGQGESLITYTNIGGGTSPRLGFNYFDGTNLTEVMSISGSRVGIGTCSPNAALTIQRCTNSGGGSTFPRLEVENILPTQGDGSTTFNFSDVRIASGNSCVQMFLATSYAAGTWEPQGLINVSTNTPLVIRTCNTERMRITSDGIVSINCNGSFGKGAKLQILQGSSNTNALDFKNTDATYGHIGTFANNLYLTQNYYYAGGQNNDSATYGQAAITMGVSNVAGDTSIDFAMSDPGATSPSSKMRLFSVGCGVLLVGTTTCTAEASLVLGAKGTVEGGQLVLQKGTSCSCATHLDNYNDSFRILVGSNTTSTGVNMAIDHKTGNTTINGAVYRYSGQTVVGGSFTNLTAIDASSSRTYLIQMIPTNVEASSNYRIFGVIQVNATSASYVFSTIASQTMDITFSGTTVQARVTNGQQWTFNWSITQLL